MKKVIILCFLTFFASFVYAQHEGHNHAAETTKEVKGALLVKEDTFNFGKIPQGKPDLLGTQARGGDVQADVDSEEGRPHPD
jgi:hypothetical protein